MSEGGHDSLAVSRLIVGGIDDLTLLEMRNNFIKAYNEIRASLDGKIVINPDYDPCEFRFGTYQPDKMEVYL